MSIETAHLEDTMSTLTELNALRIAAGMTPLKSWKESKVKLDAAVAKLTKVVSEDSDKAKANLETVVEKTLSDTKPAAAKATPKKTAKPAAKPKAEAKKDAPTGVSISTIAAECNMDPKVARAKLRRQDDVPCIEGTQWLFEKSDVAKIKAILQGDARKKD